MKKQTAVILSALTLVVLLGSCRDYLERNVDETTTTRETAPSTVESIPSDIPDTEPATTLETHEETTTRVTETVTEEPLSTTEEQTTAAPTPSTTSSPSTTTEEQTTVEPTPSATPSSSTVTATEHTPSTTPEITPSATVPAPEPTVPVSTSSESTTGTTTATPTTTTTTQAPTPVPPAPVTYPAGIYGIGSDLPPGDYVLSAPSHFQIAGDSSFEPQALLADVVTSDRTHVQLQGNEWLSFETGMLYVAEHAPAIGEMPLGPGMYKAGLDLPAGEYVLVAEDSNLALTGDALHRESGQFATIIFNRTYLYLEQGEFISFDMGQLYDVADAPAIPEQGNLPQGAYKIGTDLPAGTYTLVTTNLQYRSSFTVHANPRLVTSVAPLQSEFFNGETTVTVSDGQYLDVLQADIVRP